DTATNVTPQASAQSKEAAPASAPESIRKCPVTHKISRMAESAAKPQTEPSQNFPPNAWRGGIPYSTSERFSIRDTIQVASETKTTITARIGSSLCTANSFRLVRLWNANSRTNAGKKEIPAQMNR